MTKKPMKIVNMVATSDLKHNIPLYRLAEALPNTEYNPEQFPGLVLRITEPKCSILVFSTGKLVCTGLTSIEDIKKSINKVIESVAKIKIKITIKPEIHLQNIVSSGSLGVGLNLNKLAVTLKNVEYEPEQFPGLVHVIKNPKANFLIFSNGELVCTGVKSKEMAQAAVKCLIKELKKNKFLK